MQVIANARRYRPQADIDSVIVQAMATAMWNWSWDCRTAEAGRMLDELKERAILAGGRRSIAARRRALELPQGRG